MNEDEEVWIDLNLLSHCFTDLRGWSANYQCEFSKHPHISSIPLFCPRVAYSSFAVAVQSRVMGTNAFSRRPGLASLVRGISK